MPQKAQCHELGGDDYRGGSGPLNVSRGISGNPLHEVFIQAGVQAGYNRTEDVNGYMQEGVGLFDMTTHKVRTDSLALLTPTLRKGWGVG